jgi:hypothetical protein
MPDPATVVNLPDQPARRERQLASLWAQEDRLKQQLRELQARIRPLQREVALDRGYLFAVSRETLERPARGRR